MFIYIQEFVNNQSDTIPLGKVKFLNTILSFFYWEIIMGRLQNLTVLQLNHLFQPLAIV